MVKEKGEKGTALTEPRETVKSENLRNGDSMFHRNICIHTKEHKVSTHKDNTNNPRGDTLKSCTVQI